MKQKITIALFLVFATAAIFWACKDDEFPEPVAGETNKVTFTQFDSDTVLYRNVIFNVTIDNKSSESITDHGVCYSTSANPTFENNKVQEGSLSGNTYSSSIEGLEPNTTYHVRAFLKFREVTTYSNDVSVTTNALVIPDVETNSISYSSGVSLQVDGEILDYGGDTITSKGICWSFTTNPTVNDSLVVVTSNGDSISANIENIITDSIYYIKAFAINSVGTGYGNELIFNASTLPQLTTSAVTGISETGATCGGNITSEGGSAITKRGVCYSTNNNPTLADNYTEDGTGTGSFTSTLTGLSPATVYYVRAYATNATGTTYGNKIEFSTTGLPVLTTTAISNITATTATSGGNITDDGGYTITARGVCWSTSTEPTLSDSITVDGTGTGSFTSNLTGLEINTTYFIRAYATNENGTRYGNELNFTTEDGIPTLSTTEITNITSNSATGGGNIADDGGFAITVRGICWSTNSNPTIFDSSTTDGSGTGIYSSNLTELIMDTFYYVKAYATNESGTYYGDEKSFRTSSIYWQKCLGGSLIEYARTIQQTIDGGYIVAAYSQSNDFDVSGNHGDYDFWIIKLTSTGTISWQKSLGSSTMDFPSSIQQTIDGGYIVAGYSYTNDGDVSGNHGGYDYWIVKLTSIGTISWQNSYGGSSSDIANSIQQTSDGGYIIAGSSYSNDGDVSGNHGSYDYWIVKLTSTGIISWQNSYGGSLVDQARFIQQTTDGGYIIIGESQSNDGDVTGNHGESDYWIVKLTSTGSISWQKSIGGSSVEWARSIQQTTDGGYIIIGESQSNDGDVSGNHGSNDYWIVKITSNGTISWQNSYGGSLDDQPYSIKQTADGGYIVAGKSASNDGDVSGNHGSYDCWIVKLTSTGAMSWQKTLGGSSGDIAFSILQNENGDYVIAGGSQSNDGDVSGNHGSYDCWIVKIKGD